VCLFDRGNAKNFTCSYHGWSFNTQGELAGVPFFNDVYYGELEKEQLGLPEVRVELFGGLIFGTWDNKATSLKSYLGDFAWYLDNLYLGLETGGLEVIPGTQKYVSPGNWKIPADNFHGDHYHTPYTHGSTFRLQADRGDGIGPRTSSSALDARERQTPQGRFELSAYPHGLGGLVVGTAVYESDMARARTLGSEVVAWVEERYRRRLEQCKDVNAEPYGFSRGTIFPNFSINGGTSAFGGRGLFLWHPKGPHMTEVWEWCMVEKAAPKIVKELAVRGFSRGQAASGFFGQDDSENFERVTENTRTPLAQRQTFHYGMALRHDGQWPGQEEWEIGDMPGEFGPHIAEQNQRRFYKYWSELLEGEA
jgi:phenylpropionate dioxygenase-like ring-hydroxylating dioxygenase large terminal subunit